MSMPLRKYGLAWWKSRRRELESGRSEKPKREHVEVLTPILLSGGGRTGSTAIMELLGTDPRVAFDREYPFESRYLLYFAKFAKLLQHPEFFQFLEAEQLFDFDYLGFAGPPPATTYVPSSSPDGYLPSLPLRSTVKELWTFFSRSVLQGRPHSEFYIEKSPPWLSPIVRECMTCYTIYNVRDPRDIFISANAFMKKRNYFGFARLAEDTDIDHARHLALAFVNTFENYYADRKRSDTMLLRYEDFVLDRRKVVNDVRRLCGIVPDIKSSSDFFSVHRTAKDLDHTVNRWKSDPIPQDVILFLERALQSEMTELGYPLTQAQHNGMWKTISFDEGIDLSTLSCSADGSLEPGSECAVVDIRGIDFWVILPFDSFEARTIKEVWLSVRGDIGKVFSLYWHGPSDGFSEERCMTLGYVPSPGWSVLSFPVHSHPQWQGTVSQLRLDLFNAASPPHRGHGQIRWVRLVG